MEHKKKLLYGITRTTMSIFCCYMFTQMIPKFYGHFHVSIRGYQNKILIQIPQTPHTVINK